MQLVENGLDRFALQGWQSRQHLADRFGDVQERCEGMFESIDRVERGLYESSELRSQFRHAPRTLVHTRLTFCSAAIRFERDLADGLGRGASDGTAPTGAGRATSSNRGGQARI